MANSFHVTSIVQHHLTACILCKLDLSSLKAAIIVTWFPSHGGYKYISNTNVCMALFVTMDDIHLGGSLAHCKLCNSVGILLSLTSIHLALGMSVPPEVVKKVKALIEDEDQGVLQRWKAIKQALLDAGCAYHTKACADCFVVHPANRGGTLLNPLALHQKGADIVSAGADLAMLSHATAFELKPTLAEKQVQLNPMILLAESSDLVPQVTQLERFATVSCSHTCMFIKAVMQKCKTPEEKLQGSTPHLGPHLYQKDEDLHKMVMEGWVWCILPWWVEAAFPSLPSFAQQALNMSNSIHSLQTEMELATTILQAYKDSSTKDSIDWDKLSAQCCSGGPVKSYTSLMGKLVKNYSGKARYMKETL